MPVFHLKLGIVLIALAVLIKPEAILASDFTTTISNSYTIDQQGGTTVKQAIALTNQSADTYATSYAVIVDSIHLKQIRVLDEKGQPIPHIPTVKDNQTLIAISFTDQIVGKDKSRNFSVEYQNLDVAQKNGQVLEVNIPKLNHSIEVSQYEVNLNVPIEFGTPTTVSPPSAQIIADPAFTKLTFSGDQIKTEGISAIFGNRQIFDLQLEYYLDNPTITPIITQVAFPPDTAYQKMFYQSITPQPKEIKQDNDGNWIGTYELKPKETIKVQAHITASTYLKPTIPVPPVEVSNFLKAQKYWEVNDPQIKSLAKDLNTPEKIYRFLVDNLNYNYSRIDSLTTSRLGAKAAINDPQNVLCYEFADAFVTLARANNIPARVLTGYAYTHNNQLRPLSVIEDTLHAWAEYYDSQNQIWKMVDPTWGNTTGSDYFSQLDYNHIVFAIHGSESDKPFPAGYYRDPNNSKPMVVVDFSKELPSSTPQFTVNFSAASINPLTKKLFTTLKVQNNSSQAWYLGKVETASNMLSNPEKPIVINSILPQEQIILPINFTANSLSRQYNVHTRLFENNYELTIKPTLSLPLLVGSFGTAAIVVGAALILAKKSRRVLVP